jgi:uncharacterized tellurite resistance protein B-like protein
MSDVNLILCLGKVLIAAAWTDGSISNAEMNCLKDLLFRMNDITGRDWAMLEMYMDAPVGEGERERLVGELQAAIRNQEQRSLVLKYLDELLHGDGEPSEAECAVIEEIKATIDSGGGVLGRMTGFMKGAVRKREKSMSEASNREEHFEDFMMNKVYYGLKQSDRSLDVPEPKLRMLCLAGGLMARVAHADGVIEASESISISRNLQKSWNLGASEADFVSEVALAEISMKLDYYRLVREFFANTNDVARDRFLGALFSVAAADGHVSQDEIEEIRKIAQALKLTPQQFVAAKNQVPREIRES